MHSVVTGIAPEYISDMVNPVSELEGRANLRFTAMLLWDCMTYHEQEPLNVF